MQGLRPSSAEPASNTADWPRVAPRAYGVWALVAVIAITAARLVLLAVQSADLYPDEAQYWLWSLHPALGYYSKPPLVGWLIAATTALVGDSEFGIRLAAPFLHFGAGLLIFASARRLYSPRIAAWSAIAYGSLPG